jgi:phage regulator Rha-like protein
MDNIVFLDNGKPVTTTLIISEGVGTSHRNVMGLLKRYSNRETLSTFRLSKVSRGGRPVEYATLSEEQTTFLITLMQNSDKVVTFKEALTKEFFKQRQIISRLILQRESPDWQNVRKDGKQIYKQKTNVIKEFVEYATNQGSSSSQRYYSNIAKMQNSALFFFEQKYKNMREVLTIKQLMQVATADDVIEKALKDGMDKELPYKDIYILAKERIISYAEIIGKSPILQLSE